MEMILVLGIIAILLGTGAYLMKNVLGDAEESKVRTDIQAIRTNLIRYSYNSLTTPNSVIDFNVTDRTKEIKKEQEVLGGKFDKNNYQSQRIWATARDGQKVAISLVYHKDTAIGVHTPLLLYGYGAYGSIVNDRFSSVRLSLLDRGFGPANARAASR